MVYADVPEHADALEPQPRKPRSTEEWLEQISGQIQDLVDGLQEAIASAGDEVDDETDENGTSPNGDGADGSSSTPDQGAIEQQPNTARKTAAAKRAEVKGD